MSEQYLDAVDSTSPSAINPSHHIRQWPALAPRDAHDPSPSSTSRDRRGSGTGASGRPPRLSHRSRAGCWTCRGRKVKCDEIHPRCGPCQRLNRQCDWDHRWNFSDATPSTQRKYGNVKTDGNFVWDPAVAGPSSPSTNTRDDLPTFSNLTNDDDRERKAESQRPGTYSVVVTPESFADLPEYATISSSRRTSQHSLPTSVIGKPITPGGRHRLDPNIIVLDRFEDVSTTASSAPSLYSPNRSENFTDPFDQLALTASPQPRGSAAPAPVRVPNSSNSPDHLVLNHFRRYIVRRLFQPVSDRPHSQIASTPAPDIFEAESARFPPLHHAICAVSALNLAYNGRASLEDAMQHYHQALSTAATPTTSDDLLSDGVFLRHFLLLIYDICVPMATDDEGSDMWEGHLNHLLRIATQRHARLGREPHGYIIWNICQLDMYACLLGSGTCEFVRTVLSQNMLPPLEQQIPSLGIMGDYRLTNDAPYRPHETVVFPAILDLYQGTVIHTAKLAQAAQSFRLARRNNHTISPSMLAHWQTSVSQLQSELFEFWNRTYPEFLQPDSPQAGYNLPPRVRFVFEQAFILFQAAIIYSRTSMFHGQRLLPTANQTALSQDTENRCHAILSLLTSILTSHNLHRNPNMQNPGLIHEQPETLPSERRNLVFPVLLAGIISRNTDVKSQAADLLRSLESPSSTFSSAANTPGGAVRPPGFAAFGAAIARTSTPASANASMYPQSSGDNGAGGGIGQNTFRMRQLLQAVCEEQQRTAARGGRIESVEWLDFAKEKGLLVVNCGL